MCYARIKITKAELEEKKSKVPHADWASVKSC